MPLRSFFRKVKSLRKEKDIGLKEKKVDRGAFRGIVFDKKDGDVRGLKGSKMNPFKTAFDRIPSADDEFLSPGPKKKKRRR